MASVKSSLSLKLLLGILAVGQQFNMALAEDMCRAFNKLGEKIDLIGLIGLITVTGPAAATKSLSYSALNDSRFYLTGHIGPGSLSVAAALFEVTGFRLARLFALGVDPCQTFQLDSPNGLRYIGDSPLINAVGAAIVRESQSLWGKNPLWSNGRGRDAHRKLKVITLEVKEITEQEVRVQLKSSKTSSLLLGWLPLLLTLGGIAISCICKEWFVAGLIALGMLGMMLGVIGLRMCLFTFDMGPSKNQKDSNCLIVDDTNPDTLHIIQAKEGTLEILFQRKFIYKMCALARYVLFMAGCMLGIYVGASILYLPKVSVGGQIVFAMTNLIGFVTDMFKASISTQLGLANKGCEQFGIKFREGVVFLNRTAAVSSLAKHTKDLMLLKVNNLLPIDGPVWQKWWETLAQCVGRPDHASRTIIDAAATQYHEEDGPMLRMLLSDMKDGLLDGAQWPV